MYARVKETISAKVIVEYSHRVAPYEKTLWRMEMAKRNYAGETVLTCEESDGVRLVYLDGIRVYELELCNIVHKRYVAVQLYLTHNIRQVVIAEHWGCSARTIRSWVRDFKNNGHDGLADAVQGAPVVITEAVKKRVVDLRTERMKISDVARKMSINESSVYAILSENCKAEQPEFPEISEEMSKPADGCYDEILSEEECESVDVRQRETIDPLNRNVDRIAAFTGLIEDANPVFADCEHVEGAGAFLALAVLATTPFFDAVHKNYKSLGAAFYGLRSTFTTMFIMAVLRIKTPEKLNSYNPLKIGRLLGLDRSPSVKTLRRKIHTLASRNKGMELMKDLAAEKIEALKGVDAFLYTDGHVQCYYGKKKVGKVFSNNKKKVVKGSTDYWVNLDNGTPLLCISTEFNAHLSAILPDIIAHAKKICNKKRLTIIFDRGGADALTYEKILAMGCDFIAYHKTPKPVDLDDFEKKETVVNNRTYSYALLEREAQIPVYEVSEKSKIRRKTDRTVDLREIMIRRDDDGVTNVITSRRDLDNKVVCTSLFKRWTQENFFKYMIATYNLDHLYTYRTSKVSPDIDHPNPEYNQLIFQQKKIRSRIATIIGARKLDAVAENKLDDLADLHEGKKGEELKKLSATLKGIKQALKLVPKRESAGDYDKLDSESRIIGNTVKSTAYDAEGLLAGMVRNIWNGVNGNERGIVEGFLQTTGAIKIDGGLLKVTLQKQSTPERTRLLKYVCDELTVMAVKYPGSNLRMVFDIAC